MGEGRLAFGSANRVDGELGSGEPGSVTQVAPPTHKCP